MKLTIFPRRKNQRCPADPPETQGRVSPFPGAGEETPEAREARVAQLRHQIRDGTYQIPVYQLVRVLAALLRRKC